MKLLVGFTAWIVTVGRAVKAVVLLILAVASLFPHEGWAKDAYLRPPGRAYPITIPGTFGYSGVSLGTLDGTNFYLLVTNVRSGLIDLPAEIGAAEGVRMYQGPLDDADRARLEALRSFLCRHAPRGVYLTPLPFTGMSNLRCDIKPSPVHKVRKLVQMYEELMLSFYQKHTSTPIRLDVDYEVGSQPSGFLVTLRLINNGEQTLILRSPESWDGMIVQHPSYGTSAELTGPDFRFLLGGAQMINAGEYLDGEIVIPRGRSSEVRFHASPVDKAKKGANVSGGLISLELITPEAVRGQVDFHTINRLRTMPRDYPATPQEWEVWEAEHRKGSIMSIGASVGNQIKEDGYYRAFAETPSSAKDIAGRYVRPFRKGDIAPSVQNEVDEQGRIFPVGDTYRYWMWQADISSIVEARSGEACPKSGRWAPQIPSDVPNATYLNSLNTTVTVKYGERMPTFGFDDSAQKRACCGDGSGREACTGSVMALALHAGCAMSSEPKPESPPLSGADAEKVRVFQEALILPGDQVRVIPACWLRVTVSIRAWLSRQGLLQEHKQGGCE